MKHPLGRWRSWPRLPPSAISSATPTTVQIALQMETGKNVGMQTLDDAIQDLLTKK